jgi:putative phosphoesterase
MRIGIISDTHGSLPAWEKAIAAVFQGSDLIIHAGDLLYHGPRNPLPQGYAPRELAAAINKAPLPVVIARGNCDADVDQVMLSWPLQAPYAFLQIEGLRILVNHGHGMESSAIQAQAHRFQVELFIYGHTHIPELRVENGIVYLNPGSPSLPKGENKRPTVALLENGLVSLIDLHTGESMLSVSLK